MHSYLNSHFVIAPYHMFYTIVTVYFLYLFIVRNKMANSTHTCDIARLYFKINFEFFLVEIIM